MSFLKVLTNGWKPSAITILQSGNPFTVLNTAAYKAGLVPGSPITSASSGDYNADGTNSDTPNIPTYGYNIPTTRKAELAGVFKSTDFTAPTTLPGEGNEAFNRYIEPRICEYRLRIAEKQHTSMSGPTCNCGWRCTTCSTGQAWEASRRA